eukprot:582877-Pleurochrysis_carterae.AAC.1
MRARRSAAQERIGPPSPAPEGQASAFLHEKELPAKEVRISTGAAATGEGLQKQRSNRLHLLYIWLPSTCAHTTKAAGAGLQHKVYAHTQYSEVLVRLRRPERRSTANEGGKLPRQQQTIRCSGSAEAR